VDHRADKEAVLKQNVVVEKIAKAGKFGTNVNHTICS